MDFENKQEDVIGKIIKAETKALNSEKGRDIMSELLKKAREQNPNLTPEQWSKIKQDFLILIFNEIIKNNPSIADHFSQIVKNYFDKKRKQAE